MTLKQFKKLEFRFASHLTISGEDGEEVTTYRSSDNKVSYSRHVPNDGSEPYRVWVCNNVVYESDDEFYKSLKQ